MNPALIAAGASIGSALIGAGGQSMANAANARMAQKQMDFQERMRSTQYQTTVKDLREAGLNPALAYEKGGAGTPSGATAQMQNTVGNVANSAAAAVETYNSIRRTEAELAVMEEQRKKTGIEAATLAGLQMPTTLRAWEEAWGANVNREFNVRSMASRVAQAEAGVRATDASAAESRERQRALRIDTESPGWIRNILGRQGAEDALDLAGAWRRQFLVPALTSTAQGAQRINDSMKKNRYTKRPSFIRPGSPLDPER